MLGILAWHILRQHQQSDEDFQQPNIRHFPVMIVLARSCTASAVRQILRPSTRAFVATPLRLCPDVKAQPNGPSHRSAPQNVSGTNAVEVDAYGARDAPLQEFPEEGEKKRQMQAPNRATTWSPSQRPREEAMRGPRFEQTIMEWQVMAAIGCIIEGWCLQNESLGHMRQSNSSTNNQFDGAIIGSFPAMVEEGH